MAKPHKVEEPAGTYSVKKPAGKGPVAPVQQTTPQPVIRYADNAAFRKSADKVFKAHHELFRKLAQ